MKYKAFWFCMCVIFLSFSCSTISHHASLRGETIVGTSSDILIFVPTKHHKNLFSSLFPNQKYLDKALNKTDYLYLSLKLKDEKSASFVGGKGIEENELSSENEGEKDVSSISSIGNEGETLFESVKLNICAIGRYPKSIAGFIFNKKNGWQKEKAQNGYTYYKRQDNANSAFSFFSIPQKELALFSHNSENIYEMEDILERVDSPDPTSFDEDFDLKLKDISINKDICIFVSNPHLFLSKLVGLKLDLPIEKLKVYLTQNVEGSKEFYNYSIVLDVQNITAGFATRLLLSKLLKTQVRIEENRIIVEKAKITSDRLLQIIKRVLIF